MWRCTFGTALQRFSTSCQCRLVHGTSVYFSDDISDVQSPIYQYIHKSKIPTMHFQKSLLRLKIPELEQTCNRYLRCQKALLSAEEYSKTEQYIKDFKATCGADLHARLKVKDKANKHTSYISEPWFNMYLKDRVPIVLNYNPFMVFTPESNPVYSDAVIRASNFLVSSMRFMHSLKDSILSPEIYHLNPEKSKKPSFYTLAGLCPEVFASYVGYAYKAFPLDMSQFKNLFNSTRIPVKGKDYIKSFTSARNVLVMKNGNFFVFDIFDRNGDILSPSYIHACISYISKTASPMPKYPIGILTTENRDIWAAVRNELLEAGNGEALNAIDSAAFNIVLDDSDPGQDPSKVYRTFLYGDGRNRWFDKCFSLIITKDGNVAINFEHSWGDGVAVMRYVEEIARDSQQHFVSPDFQPDNIDASQHVKKLEFRLTPSIEAAIDNAQNSFKEATSSLAVNVFESDIFGKKFCKKHQVSPDAMMQLGFQVAYYMQNGHAAATYESCSTSAFKHGRTETVRSGTLETKKFAQSLLSQNKPSTAELKAMLMDCSRVHNQLTKEAAMGQGFDRHLFAMKDLAVSEGLPLPAFYADPSYAKLNHIILSTSTLPSDQIVFGGFAPVVRDGYGIGYQIKDDFLGISLSSYQPHRDGSGFIECSQKAFMSIYDVLCS